eukprot:jgi/Bigna1/77826/fgenesh1_pg.50_\
MAAVPDGVSMLRKHCHGCAVFTGLIDRKTCKKIVELAEESGWQDDEDTVDGKPTFQNNLKDRSPVAWQHVETLHKARVLPLLRNLFPEEDLELTGHFVRQYSPSARATLIPHQDKSVATVNILLTPRSKFKGGDVFVFDLLESREIQITSPDLSEEFAKLRRFGLKPYTRGRVQLGDGNDEENGEGSAQEGERRGGERDTTTQESKKGLSTSDASAEARVAYQQIPSAIRRRGRCFHGITKVTNGTRHVLILFYSKKKRGKERSQTKAGETKEQAEEEEEENQTERGKEEGGGGGEEEEEEEEPARKIEYTRNEVPLAAATAKATTMAGSAVSSISGVHRGHKEIQDLKVGAPVQSVKTRIAPSQFHADVARCLMMVRLVREDHPRSPLRS